jgi:hypothetical protein
LSRPFAKSDRDNIDDQELAVLREVSASWLAADAKMLGLATFNRGAK